MSALSKHGNAITNGGAVQTNPAVQTSMVPAAASAQTQVMEWCNIIVLNSKHIIDILDNVLDLSKLEAGNLELKHSPIKVMDLLEMIHSLLRSTVRHGVKFDFDVVPKDLVIQGDPQRWKQLLVNLVRRVRNPVVTYARPLPAPSPLALLSTPLHVIIYLSCRR